MHVSVHPEHGVGQSGARSEVHDRPFVGAAVRHRPRPSTGNADVMSAVEKRGRHLPTKDSGSAGHDY
jgi:Pyruvate/2-oxoacid:ferredoxin oxidoreductase gamma subunit